MKIRAKLIILFVVVAVLITLINGFVFVIQGESSLAQRTEAQLESVTVLKGNQLKVFIKDATSRLEGIARERVLVDNFLKSVENKSSQSNLGDNCQECHELLRERLVGDQDFKELFILNSRGDVYLSTDKANQGTDKISMPYFIEGKKNIFVQNFYYSIRLRQLTTVIAVPIKDYKEKVIGVLAARINLDKISNTMLERSGLGETGETYLVSKFNYMVTESRFEGGLALKGAVYNDAVKDCLKGNSGRKTYNNYRGVSTIGAYKWFSETDTCLVAEISEEEALKPVKELRDIMVVVNVVVLILTVILSFFLSRTITNPIIRLVKGTEEIRKGNLNYKIDINSKDEIGWLGRSFNEMAESLEKTTVSKAYVDSIIESMSDSLIVVTPRLKIDRVNRAASELLGYREEELINKPIEKIISFRDASFAKSALKLQIKKGSLMNQEVYYRTKAGKEVPVLFSVSLMKNEDGSINCIICTAWDITERKLAEEKIKEVAEMKSKLTSMVSHELRTPLAAIKTGINIVGDGLTGKINAEQSDFLGIVKKNVDRLGRLINDVLNFQKLESGKMQFKVEENDINQTIKEVYKIMHSLAKQKKLQLGLELEKNLPKSSFDKDRIIQVLTNLISNAIKFTDSGQVTITTRREANHVCVMVEDTGVGLRAQDLSKIFESFEQLERVKGRKIEGTGLGLAICKEIIEQHKGKIWVKSELGKGSLFSFILPIVT
ncbi:MAG: PAS domain S-box protein [Candidatus Omnitrophica bacterium]|nr:PAS domain S-box protein [Candidatus Omnitrophota bacterium]